MADFLMPALGADMETGKLVHWCVSEGSRVHPGDVVAVVETHKGAIDCEIFLDGVIEDLVPEGTELPVGGVLARVRVAGEAPAAAVAPAPAPQPALPAPAQQPSAPEPAPASAKVSPAARRRAQELGIEAAALAGTGVEGSVTVADVELAAARRDPAAAPAPPPAPAPAPARAGLDLAAMRQAIAAAMSRSKRDIPHYYLARSIDFSAAEQWLAGYNAVHAPQDRLLAAVLLLKASALALARHPQFNGFHVDGQFRPGAGVHVGWAVAMRGGGLIAPAIHDADRKPLARLMADMRDLVQRVRTGGLRSSEMTDPTVTITSLGERGADAVLGVIYPPQVALLGFGRPAPRPWVVDGAVVARTLVQASLAADHRASDGHAGGLLLAAIDEALQRPGEL